LTKFLQLFSAGVALGAIYALVSLGFVVVYRATRIINFAQVGLVLLGAFIVYQATYEWDMSFWIALPVGMILTALIGLIIERLILRRMIGQPVYALILITVGLLLLVEPVVTWIWQDPQAKIQSPFTLKDKIDIGGAKILQIDVFTAALAGLVLLAFFLFFRYTKYGVAMRATAADQEAALMQGISVSRIFALSWGLAGAVAAVAGAMVGAGAGPGTGLGVSSILLIALRALPAMVLGGLDSPLGAVLGGLIIGVSEILTKGYQAEIFPGLPQGFGEVVPYVVMVAVLLVRPAGLFGTREVRRV
jgi:branched-chain amino acid transport system permease protein